MGKLLAMQKTDLFTNFANRLSFTNYLASLPPKPCCVTVVRLEILGATLEEGCLKKGENFFQGISPYLVKRGFVDP
jgi:hypothetical protein